MKLNNHCRIYTAENQGKGFIISFNGMTLEACIELASMGWSSVSGGFIGMGIDQNGVVQEVVSACSKQSDESRGLSFLFK